jgi:hypothetical protein
VTTRPSPEIIAREPHLAVLDIVGYSLDTAVRALMDDFPALQGDPHPWRPDPPDLMAARRLLRQMLTFSRALDRYRSALTAALTPPSSPGNDNDDIDF